MNILDILTDNPKHGIIVDLPRDEYFATPGLNPSTIVKRRKSALAAKDSYEEESKDTPAKDFGSCCHSLLFEPDRFETDWMVWPDKDKRGNEWAAFKAEAESSGRKIIKDGDQQYGFRLAVQAVQRALKKPKIRELVKEGLSEVAVFSAERGMQCKGLMDRIDTRGGNILDAKFTTDIDAIPFGRSAGRFGYHIKMACYREWFRRETGKEVNGVYLLTIEVERPWDSAVVPVTELDLEDGWAQAKELIQKIEHSARTNTWHGVDEGEDYYALELPYYAMQEMNDVEV